MLAGIQEHARVTRMALLCAAKVTHSSKVFPINKHRMDNLYILTVHICGVCNVRLASESTAEVCSPACVQVRVAAGQGLVTLNLCRLAPCIVFRRHNRPVHGAVHV